MQKRGLLEKYDWRQLQRWGITERLLEAARNRIQALADPDTTAAATATTPDGARGLRRRPMGER